MPNNPTLNQPEDIRPLKERYRDVNKNEIKFVRKEWVNIEYNNTRRKLPLLITKRTDIIPLLRVNWLKQLPITINIILLDKETNQPETTIRTKFKELSETYHTYQKHRSEDTDQTGLLPNTTESTTYTVLPTILCNQRIRPTDKIRTIGKIRNN